MTKLLPYSTSKSSQHTMRLIWYWNYIKINLLILLMCFCVSECVMFFEVVSVYFNLLVLLVSQLHYQINPINQMIQIYYSGDFSIDKCSTGQVEGSLPQCIIDAHCATICFIYGLVICCITHGQIRFNSILSYLNPYPVALKFDTYIVIRKIPAEL